MLFFQRHNKKTTSAILTGNRKPYGLSNGAIFNDLERRETQISRSRHHLTMNAVVRPRERFDPPPNVLRGYSRDLHRTDEKICGYPLP